MQICQYEKDSAETRCQLPVINIRIMLEGEGGREKNPEMHRKTILMHRVPTTIKKTANKF